jgi:hypothetical protein
MQCPGSSLLNQKCYYHRAKPVAHTETVHFSIMTLQSNRKCEDMRQNLVHLQRQYQALQVKALDFEQQCASTARAMEDQVREQARLRDILHELRVPQAAINGDASPSVDNAAARRKAREYVAEAVDFVARAYGGTEEAGNLEESMSKGEGCRTAAFLHYTKQRTPCPRDCTKLHDEHMAGSMLSVGITKWTEFIVRDCQQ